MDNKTFKKMLLGMAMASPLALINSGNAHASSVKTNVETNWHANSLATVQQELRNQNINPDYKITNAKYIVQAGDTLSQIAAATHINMYHIAAVNHIQNLNLIYVGQVLILNQGNEVAHNVAGNGSTTAASIGNTYTLRSTSQQPVLNYYGHTQAQGTTGTPNVQRTANVNSKGTPTAEKPAKAIIPSTPSANNNNQNVKPATPTGNTGSHVTGNTSTNTGSTATQNTQGSASQTGSSATQGNNSQKTPAVDSSSASQQAPAQSSNAQQPASSVSHATTPNASSNTQQPASSASSASQPTGSSQAQGSVNTGSTATPSNSQKTPIVDSSSASSNTQQPAQSSSSQGSVSSSSQQTTTSSSSAQQPASSASSSSQSSASSSASSNTQQPASSASSSSQSSASSSASASSNTQQPASSTSSSSQSSTSSSASSSSQKTVDGYTLDNMPLSVFNDKKNLNAINNTFSGDAIENYFNNHIGKGNMTWDEAQQAQQNGTITSAILAWNGQMLPTQMSQDMAKSNGTMANAEYDWRGALPVSYLNGDNQMTEINKQYGSLNGDTLTQAQSEKLTSYLNSLLNTYSSGKSTNPQLQAVADKRAEELTSYSHDGFENVDAQAEVLDDLGNINEFQNKNMFDILAHSSYGMYQWIYDDADSNWGHRDNLKNYNNWAFSIKVLSNGEVILIGEGQ